MRIIDSNAGRSYVKKRRVGYVFQARSHQACNLDSGPGKSGSRVANASLEEFCHEDMIARILTSSALLALGT